MPALTEAPANGSALFRALVRRQVLSLDWLRRPSASGGWARSGRTGQAAETREVEWPRIRAEIDAGRLAVVGLVRHARPEPVAMARSHQVLAYA